MSARGSHPYKKKKVWVLILTDFLLAALIVGGWFAARIIPDFFIEDVPEEMPEQIVFVTPAPTPVRVEATPEPEVTPEPTPDTRSEWQIRFEDHFTDEVVTTENSYSSPNLSVTVTHHEVGEGDKKITYHLADIYIGNIDCFRSGLAKTPPRFHMSASLLKMMEDNNAVVAVNGDFCGYSYGGVVVRNGTVWTYGGAGVDTCVLFRDGRMETHAPGKFRVIRNQTENIDEIFQVWSFGPGLLNEDGTPRNIPWSSIPNEYISGRNPRTAIGYYEPGHYCFLVVDGRQKGYSIGMTLQEMSELFYQLGCKAAFNLDGGGSSMMAFRGELVSQIYASVPRNLSDCVYITDFEPISAEEPAEEDIAPEEGTGETPSPDETPGTSAEQGGDAA